nr:MinD/ParA family protein [Gordonia sputi]
MTVNNNQVPTVPPWLGGGTHVPPPSIDDDDVNQSDTEQYQQSRSGGEESDVRATVGPVVPPTPNVPIPPPGQHPTVPEATSALPQTPPIPSWVPLPTTTERRPSTDPTHAVPPQSLPPHAGPPFAALQQGPPQQTPPEQGQPQGVPHQFGAPTGFGVPTAFGAPTGFGAPHFGGPVAPQDQYAPGLDSGMLLRKARRPPRSGWRRTVHRISGGTISPSESRATVYHDELVRQLNAPVHGDFRIAVLSLKGGVGKTTTTVGLGSTFASLRGDRVIAVDANPDLGTLSQRVPQQTSSTVQDVLLDEQIHRYSDVRRHTSQSASRLEVLASERDPATAETFDEQDYRTVIQVLERFYNIILTDCGTGLSHSAMDGVLDLAHSLIIVSTAALDGARSASATLDWLEAHGYGHLVSRAIVVLSGPRRGSASIDLTQLAQHFLARTRAVQVIPFDDHLSEGAEVDLDLLAKSTRRAFVELAATVAEDFALLGDHRRRDYVDPRSAQPWQQ